MTRNDPLAGCGKTGFGVIPSEVSEANGAEESLFDFETGNRMSIQPVIGTEQ
jgi:hypothetical protein